MSVYEIGRAKPDEVVILSYSWKFRREDIHGEGKAKGQEEEKGISRAESAGR